MQNTSQLISSYLDGELDDEGVERLANFLRKDTSAIDQLVVDSFVHSQLYHWMNLRQLRDEILADAIGGMELDRCSLESLNLLDGAEALGLATLDSAETPDRAAWGRGSRRNWLGMVASLATMLLIGVSIYTAYLLFARPAIVAQLTDAKGCHWDVSMQKLPVGSLLEKGQHLNLRSGRALVTFACGAQMVIEGPATVELASESKARLSQGRVGAKVPTQAIGFTVATPSADFVDLGTEFTLTLEADNACELQVFDGLVEIRLLERDRQAIQQRLRISEGSAVRFDAVRPDVVTTPYDLEQRIVP